MRYYNPSSDTIAHEQELLSAGIDIKNRIVMDILGWYDLYDNDQYIYNQNICKLVQSGSPILTNDNYYVQNYQIINLSYAEMLDKLDTMKYYLYSNIDTYINNQIIAGFEAEMNIDNVTTKLHFSYDKIDQNNFSDAANLSMISLNIDIGIYTVDWNGYKNYSPETGGTLVVLNLNAMDFLKLYSCALHHKMGLLQYSEEMKTVANSAVSIDDLKIKMTNYPVEVYHDF